MRLAFWKQTKASAIPAQAAPQTKAGSFMLSVGPGRFLANTARYTDLATEGYSQNSVANACINRIASAIASIDLQLYKKTKGGKLTKVDDHPLLDLLENPNPTQSGKEFMEWLVSYFYISGNAYIFANAGMTAVSRARPPTELQLLNPGSVKIADGNAMFPLAYEYRTNGQDTRFPVDQKTGRSAVMHLKTFNPLHPHLGLSPLLAAAYGIDIFNSGNKWNKRLLDNDARPSGALVVKGSDGNPATLSEEQYQRLKEMIDGQFSGTNNAGRPMLLEGGLDWKEMSLNAKDSDFLNGKHSAARDIGLVFGVPPQILGIPGDATFANYEQASLSFWTDTVLPKLAFILEGFNRWLTPLYGDDLYLWYDEDMIPALEPRRKAKAERINSADYLTVNEKRRAMGYDDYRPSENPADQILVPTSDIPLDLAGMPPLPEPDSPAAKPDEEQQDEAA